MGYYLDLVYVFKCLVNLSDPFISVINSTRPRGTVSSKGTLLNTIRANTVTFENSFYRRAPRIWNTLSAHLRNTGCSVARFNKDLFNYYLHLSIAKSVYDIDTPQTFKSACSIRLCVVDFLSMSSPIPFFYIGISFLVVS